MSVLSIEDHFKSLHDECGLILLASTHDTNSSSIAKSLQFANEMEQWIKFLELRAEAQLINVATLEYRFALLALAQGHYRQSFKSLRLVFELTLQAILLSADEICLREWLSNRKDTNWSSIVDEDNGVFSKRFSMAFFPELTDHIQHFRSLSISIYRECSECVHGNVPKHIPLPLKLEFNQEVFDLWHSKSDTVTLVLHFALALRYLKDFSGKEIEIIEPLLTDRLGHISQIRHVLGGPIKG